MTGPGVSPEDGPRTQADAADGLSPVDDRRVDIGHRLVLEIADVDVVAREVLPRHRDIGALAERVFHRCVDVDHGRLEGDRLGRLDPRVPEIRRRGVVDERPNGVLRAVDRRLRENHRLFAGRDLRFRLHDVERRHGANLDPGAVVLERLARQVERLPLHVEVADRIHQIVIGVAHVARRDRDRLLQLDVRDLPVVLADQQLLARAVDLEVSQQRLRVAGVERRGELGIEAGENVVGGGPAVVPVDLVTAAVPRRERGDAEVHARAAGGQLAGVARQQARRRLCLIDEVDASIVKFGV